jgi:hypothetical protein
MMTEAIITFRGRILDKEDNPVERAELMIQFLNLEENRWVNLVEEVVVADGQLVLDLDLKSEELRDNRELLPFFRALETNNIPTMRLVYVEPGEEDMMQVLALGGMVSFNNDDPDNPLIPVDFGAQWLIDPYKYQQLLRSFPELQHWLVTLPRPEEDNEFYEVLKKALNGGDDATIEELLAQLAALREELLIEQEKVSNLTTALEAERAKTESLTASLTEVKAALVAEQEKVANLSKQLLGEQAKNEKLTVLLATEQKKVLSLQSALEAETEKVVELTADLATAQEDIERLEAEKEDILNRGSVTANEVYTSIVNELEKTTENLSDSSGRYAVSNLSLTLKTHVKQEDDGFKLQLIDSARADYVEDGTISDVQIDIISKEPPSVTPAASAMPKVIGLTETAARNRLSNSGLNMKTIYQAVNSDEIPLGQAFKQIPEAGEDINAGDTVTVIFAKGTSDFN